MKFSLLKLFGGITIISIFLSSVREHLLNGTIFNFLKDFFYTTLSNLCIFSGRIIPLGSKGIISAGQSLGEMAAFSINGLTLIVLILLFASLFMKDQSK